MQINLTVDLTPAQENRLKELLFERQVEGGVDGLLRGLIGDLLNTQDTGGSDERLYAETWLERRWHPFLSATDFLKDEYESELLASAANWEIFAAEWVEEGWTEDELQYSLLSALEVDFPYLPSDALDAWATEWLSEHGAKFLPKQGG